MILVARALLLDAGHWVVDGGLVVRSGRITRVLASRRAVLRARSASAERFIDLGDLVLTPGLVDAHAHLELGALHGRLTAKRGFANWIRALVHARAALMTRDLARGVREGAQALLRRGTTAVGDIDATGTSARIAGGLGLRCVVYREVLDAWDGARTLAVLSGVRA